MIGVVEEEKELPDWQTRAMCNVHWLEQAGYLDIPDNAVNFGFVQLVFRTEQLFQHDCGNESQLFDELERLWFAALKLYEPDYIWPGSSDFEMVADAHICRLGLVIDIAARQCKARGIYKVDVFELGEEASRDIKAREEPGFLAPPSYARIRALNSGTSPHLEVWLSRDKALDSFPVICIFPEATINAIRSKKEFHEKVRAHNDAKPRTRKGGRFA